MTKYILLVLLTFCSAIAMFGQSILGNKNDDKTLSPYFLVMSNNSDVDALPLLSTSADVKISGVIADVTVRQLYKNSGEKPLEAVYIFPASTRAAVYGMTMYIGDRILKAEVQTRQQARETYETAKEQGRSTSLLEQERPNVFQMNVANIMPGDTVIIELKYTELLIPDDGVYEFVYPTVVGPRYSKKKKKNVDEKDEFVEVPYQHEGESPLYDFDIHVILNAGMPIQSVMSPSHNINFNFTDENKAVVEIKLSEDENKAGNKDFVLRYILSGEKINTGLLLSKGEKENFFLLMLQPPKKVQRKDIPPREYVFIIDVSGSMNGYPLNIAKKMIEKLLNSLQEKDLFNVILFAGSSHFLNCMSVPATKDNINAAMSMINAARGGGGTELIPALKKVYNNPKQTGYSRSIVILTDGFIDVEKQTFDLIAKNLNTANVFAFGIGTSVNRYLIEGMARAGNGQPFFVLNKNESEKISKKFIKYIAAPVLTDVNIKFYGFNAYDVEPIRIADVMEQRPIIVYGKWSGLPQGKITVSGKTADATELHVDIPISVFAGDKSNDALKYLWARNRIASLSDYNFVSLDSNIIKQITELGLKYNLLTEYTSFVSVDYKIRNFGKNIVKVVQPLPLPAGVSNLAVGGTGRTAYYNTGMTGGAMHRFTSAKSTALIDDFSTGGGEDEHSISAGEKSSIKFTDVIHYPEKALNKGIQGKIVVWALYKRDKRLDKCIFIKQVQSSFPILFQATKAALLKTRLISTGGADYVWKKLEIEFDAAAAKASIIKTLQVVNVIYSPEIQVVKTGKGKKISKVQKVKIKYSIFTDECKKIEFEKTLDFVLSMNDVNPVFNLLLAGHSEGAIIKANIPVLLYNPEANVDKYNYKYNVINIEILKSENDK